MATDSKDEEKAISERLEIPSQMLPLINGIKEYAKVYCPSRSTSS